jgi:hypothetical protein
MKRGKMDDDPLLFTQPFLWVETSDVAGAGGFDAAADTGAAHAEAPTDGEGTMR